ncbi:condensation domain-containing protein, partial [Dyella sp.]|uniref:condensation domain-containing protein n=1 Tax=Dyella sp. TaxID=1869338 RepID=UPI002B46A647
MTSISQIVDEAIDEGVYLFVKDDRLAFKAKEGRMSDALREKLGRYKTEIIAYLRDMNEGTEAWGGALPAIERLHDRIGVLASFAQQRLWLVDQIDGSSSEYNASVILRLQGRLDRQAMQRALDAVVERHEVLRTNFAAAGEVVIQVINESAAVPVSAMNLSSLDAERQQSELASLAQWEAKTPFDLSKDLMLRAVLIVLSDTEHALIVTQHHIASDGWSVGILIREFNVLYAAFVRNEVNPLAPLDIQYADYAQWQRSWLKGEVLDSLLGYWSTELSGAPPVHALPLAGARPARQSHAGAVYRQHVEERLTSALKLLCQRQNVTFFMLMQTAFALWMSRLSHESDVVIGTPIAGRSHQQLEALIGFFVNNLVLRSRFDRNMPFCDALAAQKQTILQAYAHQHIPFETLVGHLKPARRASYDPIFQIVFGLGLNNDVSASLSLSDLQVSTIQQESTLAKVDLELTVIEQADQLEICWTYRTDLFDEKLISEFARSYAQLLRQIVMNPHRGIFEYALLDGERHDQLLAAGQGALKPYVQEACIHTQFEAQVARTPAAIAVQYAGQALTYAQLNDKADRLARYLVDAGVTHEARVGIHLSRSLELMIAVLGVLKAGGAYVPLEPGLPKDRLSYMVQDAGIGWVVVASLALEGLPLQGVDVVMMDGAATEAQWLGAYAQGSLPRVEASDLAYVMYT